MGNMDIAEKRLLQDGRVGMNISGKDIDLRISTIPTIYGEKAVTRILGSVQFSPVQRKAPGLQKKTWKNSMSCLKIPMASYW